MNIGNDYLNVVIERKKIKNIYFRINEKNEIYVTCSKYVSDREIMRLLQNNEENLKKMYQKVKKKSEETAKVLFLGKELEYIYYSRIILDDARIFAPSIESANKYLESICLNVFEERLKLYIDKFDNLPKFRLRVRKMKTRWGVCNRGSMTVTLNTELIHKAPYLIDYVIVHELSHFEHMNHSRDFWKCVERHYPRYKEARKELKG